MNDEFSSSEPSGSVATAPRVTRLQDLADELLAEAEARYRARQTGVPLGPLTGFKNLDLYLGGYLPVGLNLLSGPPSVGKSAFCSQVAVQAQCSALYVSCEMGPTEVLLRLIARQTGVYLGRLKSGEYKPDEIRELLDETIAEVPSLYIYDATRQYAPPEKLLEAALVARGDASSVLVVIDSIHSWVQYGSGEGTEYDVLNAATRSLLQLAHRLNGPVFAIIERNRLGMKGGMHSGRGTGRFEYVTETFMSLDQGDTKTFDEKGEMPVVLTVEKNRHGAKGRRFRFQFHGALQKFRAVK